MKIGVISDTHRHIENLNQAIEFLKILGAKTLVHLGDNYKDMDETGEENVIRVPGVFSNEYQKHDIQNRMIEKFEDWRVLITHTMNSHENDLADDIKPEQAIKAGEVDVVLYGHTHVPEIKKEQGVVFINPGHLKDEDKRGYPPMFGFLDITKEELLVRIFRLGNYTVYQEETFNK